MDEIPEVTIELDQPDDRDFIHEELFGATDDLPEEAIYLPEHIQNQASFPTTRMACSRYGACHAINGQNRYVSSIDGTRYFELPAKLYWEAYLQVNPAAKTEGATLQSSLDQFLKLKFITGYSKVVSIQDMKLALSKCRLIVTGSKNANWASVRDKKMYEVGNGSAHIFAIVGYDKQGWVAINSYGSSNGMFHIPYSLTDTLFTRYAVSDFRDEQVVANK